MEGASWRCRPGGGRSVPGTVLLYCLNAILPSVFIGCGTGAAVASERVGVLAMGLLEKKGAMRGLSANPVFPWRSALMTLPCPLCLTSDRTEPVRGADRRRYFHCPHCRLIFTDPRDMLSPEQERARYGQHQNSIEDSGYVRFLQQILRPMLPLLNPAMRGLDYGCGPGPVLSQLLRREGLACDDYDPLFAPGPLQPPYDFILSTECFEHFHVPGREIARVCGLLAPGGLLGIMTEFWTTRDRFATWSYTRDRTHVAFYHRQTLDVIARCFGLELFWQDGCRVALFRCRPAA